MWVAEISGKTVSNNVSATLSKLGVQDRVEAAGLVRGLLEAPNDSR